MLCLPKLSARRPPSELAHLVLCQMVFRFLLEQTRGNWPDRENISSYRTKCSVGDCFCLSPTQSLYQKCPGSWDRLAFILYFSEHRAKRGKTSLGIIFTQRHHLILLCNPRVKSSYLLTPSPPWLAGGWGGCLRSASPASVAGHPASALLQRPQISSDPWCPSLRVVQAHICEHGTRELLEYNSCCQRVFSNCMAGNNPNSI